MSQDPSFLLECLLAARRDPSVLADEEVSAAVEAAQADAAIVARARDAAAFDDAFRTALEAHPVPSELRARLENLAAPASTRTVFWSTWGHWTAFGGMAAAIALLALSFTFLRPDASADWEPSFARFVSETEARSLDSVNVDRVRDWSEARVRLADWGTSAPARPPRGICPSTTSSCRTIEINGVKAGVVCFDTQHGLVHLLTFKRAEVPLNRCIDKPLIRRVGTHTVATWSSGDEVYMLLGDLDQNLMASLF